MNYSKIYNNLVSNKTKRKKDKNTYYESHHIIPRCLGGGDEVSNLVLLTAREHFIAHRLLSKIYPQDLNLKLAVLFMASTETLGEIYKVTSRTYSTLKTEASEARKAKASHANTMEFIHNVRTPRSLVNLMRKTDYYKKSKSALRRVIIKYAANLLIADSLGMSLTYSRNRALKIKGNTSPYLILRCEEMFIEKGYINVFVDSKSPLSTRRNCRIDVCTDLNSVIPCVGDVLEVNQRVLEETMGDCFRKLFQVDVPVPVGVGYRDEIGQVQEYKIIV